MSKFCGKCGANLNDNEKFCPACGTMQTSNQTHNTNASSYHQDSVNQFVYNPKPKKAKKQKVKMSKAKKAKIIIFLILILIVALAVTFISIYFSSPAYGVYKNMKSENYSEAIDNYEEDINDSFIQKTILKIALNDYENKVIEKFKKDDISYNSAVQALEALEKMEICDSKDLIKQVTEINDYDTAIDKGNSYYESGDYENAIKEYAKISDQNENYEKAQEKLKEIYPKYISEITETVNKYINDEKYENAISLLNTALELLPEGVDDSSLTTLKNSTLSDYKTSVVYSATELLNSSKYIEALEVIEKALEIDDNEEFKNTKTTIETKYIESVKSDIQAMLDKKDFAKALAMVNNALVVLPQNKELTDLATKIEKETPICITTLERIEFGRYTGNEGDSCLNILGEEHDRGYGNIGVEGEVFKNGFEGWIARWNGTAEKSWVFATYDLDSKYKTFSGSTGLIQSYNTKNFNTTLYIYGDDKLLYSQELTAGKYKFDFEFNVKNVDSLKIMLKDNVAVEGGTSIALHNLYLTPADN